MRFFLSSCLLASVSVCRICQESACHKFFYSSVLPPLFRIWSALGMRMIFIHAFLECCFSIAMASFRMLFVSMLGFFWFASYNHAHRNRPIRIGLLYWIVKNVVNMLVLFGWIGDRIGDGMQASCGRQSKKKAERIPTLYETYVKLMTTATKISLDRHQQGRNYIKHTDRFNAFDRNLFLLHFTFTNLNLLERNMGFLHFAVVFVVATNWHFHRFT